MSIHREGTHAKKQTILRHCSQLPIECRETLPQHLMQTQGPHKYMITLLNAGYHYIVDKLKNVAKKIVGTLCFSPCLIQLLQKGKNTPVKPCHPNIVWHTIQLLQSANRENRLWNLSRLNVIILESMITFLA